MTPKIAFMFPQSDETKLAQLSFTLKQEQFTFCLGIGFVGLAQLAQQLVCTLNIFDPSGKDLLGTSGADEPSAFFPIEPAYVAQNSGTTFTKLQSVLPIDIPGDYRVVCTLYEQGFGNLLDEKEIWFHIVMQEK